MKQARQVSGIFFRFKNPDTNRWENWVFEDLPQDEQRKIISQKSPDWVAELAIQLAERLYSVCEQFDITAVRDEEEEDRDKIKCHDCEKKI